MAYDRYRFQLISDDPEEVLPEEDMAVLKNLNVVYLNIVETNMILMSSEKQIYVYNIQTKEFVMGPYRLPSEIEAKIVIDEKFSKVQNKISQMQGGLPKFKLLNQNVNQDIKNFMNGNQFEIVFLNNSFSVIS